MDNISKNVLEYIFDISFNSINQLNGLCIPRENLLSLTKYETIQNTYLIKLKTIYSSSFNTSMHNNAIKKQKFPLLNLTRQILHIYGIKLIPIRKSNGYFQGRKKYKRFFQVKV